MKYPSYIKEQDLKNTQFFYRKIREKQGIRQALIFKKLSLVAAYGQMYKGKITYSDFLREVNSFFKKQTWGTEDGYEEPFSEFWHIEDNQYKQDTASFYIKDRLIINATLKQIEEEIIYMLKIKYHFSVKPIYTDICKKILKEYEKK